MNATESKSYSRRAAIGGLAGGGLSLISRKAAAQAAPPNVLLIVLDDMNDWIGCLNVHPQASTPHIDALARRGVNFTNAHVQAPLCNPSRASFLSGLRPSTTGIYGLAPSLRSVASLRDHVTLPEHFTKAGYQTVSLGKIYHTLEERYRAREFQTWLPAPPAPRPPKRIAGGNSGGRVVDWGAFPERDEDMGDYKLASLAVEHLKAAPAGKPQFLAVGFSSPHVPCYAPQHWFDRVPLDQVLLPPIKHGDRSDTPPFSWYLHWKLPEPRLAWYEKYNELKPFVRAYLAATSFVDAQVGRLLQALKETGREDHTIVAFIGDNGYHLGEQEVTGKNTLWERSTHVPLILAGPGVGRRQVADPAELLDLYPTLADLTGIPAGNGLEGRSLVPQIHGARRTAPAITTSNANNHAIRTNDWRYIRYADGSEELYDKRADPNEWTNLAASPKHRSQKKKLAAFLPKVNAPHVTGSAVRTLRPDGKGGWLWEDAPIVPGEIPQEPTPIG